MKGMTCVFFFFLLDGVGVDDASALYTRLFLDCKKQKKKWGNGPKASDEEKTNSHRLVDCDKNYSDTFQRRTLEVYTLMIHLKWSCGGT